MPELKLLKIPDRTPVKMAILISPDLVHSLQDYAAVYEAEYGSVEDVPALIPYMLANFLENDRGFQLARRKLVPNAASREEAGKTPNSSK